jgi:hypothetical protein
MRFMLYHHRKEENAAEPSAEHVAGIAKLIGDMKEAGVLIATEGLRPSAEAKKVHFREGKVTITDGPFTEAKELIAGFALVDVPSIDEALKWSQRFVTLMGEGTEGVVAPLFEPWHVKTCNVDPIKRP